MTTSGPPRGAADSAITASEPDPAVSRDPADWTPGAVGRCERAPAELDAAITASEPDGGHRGRPRAGSGWRHRGRREPADWTPGAVGREPAD